MTAAAANINRKTRKGGRAGLKVLNSEIVYRGTLVSILDAQAASGNGYLQAFQAAAGELPIGLCDKKITGDTAASPIPESEVDTEEVVLRDITVTGLAGSVADVGKPVYFSDDNVMTLTRPTRGYVVGIVIRQLTSTTADVLIGSAIAMMALNGGFAKETINLGVFNCATIVNGNILTGYEMPFKGLFLEMNAYVRDAVVAGTGGTTTLNAEIDGTDITGHTVVVSTTAGDAIGKKLAGSGTPAGEIYFQEGSALDIEAASTTAMSAGSFFLQLLVLRMPGT